MLPWEKTIPEYLTNRRNTVNFILFTAAFALIFINIYSPFGANKWLNLGDAEFFLYSSIVILIGMLVIVISRVLMYMATRNRPITYLAYGLWIIGEILILALVYALIQWFFLRTGHIDFSITYRNSLRITSFIIMLPYVISWLYLSFKDKYTTLEKIGTNLNGHIRNSNSKPVHPLSMIPFHDEKGVLRFSIKREDLLYVEAADNYIVVYYLDQNKSAKYMIRNTLKRLESEMPYAGLIRCHRSFMVNIDNVKFLRKEKDGLIIGFDSPVQINVPISKTYLDGVIRKLSNYTEVET